jgi:F-type H+-transporting ATPase subunit gamma
MLDAYVDGKIDQLHLVFNTFVNSMTQKPNIEQVLPLQPDEALLDMKYHWDYIYEPEAREVLDHLLQRYIESIVYQGVVENIACEQAARMVAMKSASDNAGKLIDELKLVYNKARQASITQELAEIVGGAAAI